MLLVIKLRAQPVEPPHHQGKVLVFYLGINSMPLLSSYPPHTIDCALRSPSLGIKGSLLRFYSLAWHPPRGFARRRCGCRALSGGQPSCTDGMLMGSYLPAFQKWIDRCNDGQGVLLGSRAASLEQPSIDEGAAPSRGGASLPAFLPLLLRPCCVGGEISEGNVFGYLTPQFALQLVRFPEVFVGEEGPEHSIRSVALSPSLATLEQRTAAVAGVLQALWGEGLIEGWRNELYPVVQRFEEQPAFLVERAAATRLGIKSYGIHVNGYVALPDGSQEMWVARRSPTKPSWPGKLDNIAAGGQPHGVSCAENVAKECWEEAGIPPELARAARAVSVAGYTAIQRLGLKRDVLFCYDLELPLDFVPQPQDGEAEGFERLPVLEVAHLVATSDQFKNNCNLVLIDFFVRHGYLTPDMPAYAHLLCGLRPGDCS